MVRSGDPPPPVRALEKCPGQPTTPTMSVFSRLTVVALAVAAGVLVCILQLTGPEPEAPAPATASKLAAGPLAAPTDKPVLRIEGVAHGNVRGDRTELDFETIDALARDS